MNKVILVCIKEIEKLENCDENTLFSYASFFKIGYTCEFEFDYDFIQYEIHDRNTFSYVNGEFSFCFHKDEIDEYFITLEQWREEKINKIIYG